MTSAKQIALGNLRLTLRNNVGSDLTIVQFDNRPESYAYLGATKEWIESDRHAGTPRLPLIQRWRLHRHLFA